MFVGDESRPCGRKLQQAKRVSRRSRVEDDVIESSGRLGIAKQFGEFIESGDLDRACAGQLLFHAVEGGFGEHSAVRPDHPIAVGLCGRFRIDVQREQSVGAGDRGRRTGQPDAQNLVEIRCRVRADQQHPLALLGQSTPTPHRRAMSCRRRLFR